MANTRMFRIKYIDTHLSHHQSMQKQTDVYPNTIFVWHIETNWRINGALSQRPNVRMKIRATEINR